jgi:hypothetical protein
VQAFLVVDLLEKHADASAGVGEIAILGPENLFVLEGLNKRLARRVIPGITLT